MRTASKGTFHRHAAGVVAAAGVLACLVAGCGHKVARINDEAQFQAMVVQADRPVLVDFYKGGCPSCALLDPVMDKLAKDYRGRATIAKFELMKPHFAITSEKLRDRYEVYMYPTVILFSDGDEIRRWELGYSESSYRKAIDELLAGKAAGPPGR